MWLLYVFLAEGATLWMVCALQFCVYIRNYFADVCASSHRSPHSSVAGLVQVHRVIHNSLYHPSCLSSCVGIMPHWMYFDCTFAVLAAGCCPFVQSPGQLSARNTNAFIFINHCLYILRIMFHACLVPLTPFFPQDLNSVHHGVTISRCFQEYNPLQMTSVCHSTVNTLPCQ
jgi:hypothetical protein